VTAGETGQAQMLHRPALDDGVLADLTGGDPAQTRALLLDFLDSTVEDQALLEDRRSAGDLHGMTRQAHKIKGAARLVGALELAEAAAVLETAGRSSDWASVLPLAVDVATAVERLRLYVLERYPE
jgi:HPt (histidine-containing phosphotransfer) domain-containing protein